MLTVGSGMATHRPPHTVILLIEDLAVELAEGLPDLPRRHQDAIRDRLGGCLRAVAETVQQVGSVVTVGRYAHDHGFGVVAGSGLIIHDDTLGLIVTLSAERVADLRATLDGEPSDVLARGEVVLWARDHRIDAVLRGLGLVDIDRIAALIVAAMRGHDG